MTKEILKQALEALENHEGNYKLGNAGCDRQEAAITAIKEALAQPAQPEQEPTPWRDMIVVTLVREGINKHRARELADHFAAKPEQQAEPCIGKDPRCPCQDGDACHYKDCGDTKALPVPQAEPVSCRFCHSKKGCWTWQCYTCGEIDDVQQPAAQPVQEPPQYSLKAHWTDDKRIGVVACVTRPDGGVHLMQTIIDPPPPVQRKPLTDEEIDALANNNGTVDFVTWWRQLARAIEAAHGIKENT